MTITFSSAAKRPPAFYETRNVSIVRVSLWDATPSSVAETSDSEAITAVSTKIPALCNPTLCRRVFRDVSNDHAAYIFKGSQILLGLVMLEYGDGTMLGKVWETPRDMTSHPTRLYLHSQLRENLLKSRVHHYFFFSQAAASTLCDVPIN
jgi:hypothetical protein